MGVGTASVLDGATPEGVTAPGETPQTPLSLEEEFRQRAQTMEPEPRPASSRSSGAPPLAGSLDLETSLNASGISPSTLRTGAEAPGLKGGISPAGGALAAIVAAIAVKVRVDDAAHKALVFAGYNPEQVSGKITAAFSGWQQQDTFKQGLANAYYPTENAPLGPRATAAEKKAAITRIVDQVRTIDPRPMMGPATPGTNPALLTDPERLPDRVDLTGVPILNPTDLSALKIGKNPAHIFIGTGQSPVKPFHEQPPEERLQNADGSRNFAVPAQKFDPHAPSTTPTQDKKTIRAQASDASSASGADGNQRPDPKRTLSAAEQAEAQILSDKCKLDPQLTTGIITYWGIGETANRAAAELYALNRREFSETAALRFVCSDVFKNSASIYNNIVNGASKEIEDEEVTQIMNTVSHAKEKTGSYKSLEFLIHNIDLHLDQQLSFQEKIVTIHNFLDALGDKIKSEKTGSFEPDLTTKMAHYSEAFAQLLNFGLTQQEALHRLSDPLVNMRTFRILGDIVRNHRSLQTDLHSAKLTPAVYASVLLKHPQWNGIIKNLNDIYEHAIYVSQREDIMMDFIRRVIFDNEAPDQAMQSSHIQQGLAIPRTETTKNASLEAGRILEQGAPLYIQMDAENNISVSSTQKLGEDQQRKLDFRVLLMNMMYDYSVADTSKYLDHTNTPRSSNGFFYKKPGEDWLYERGGRDMMLPPKTEIRIPVTDSDNWIVFTLPSTE
jgi:hypothetical protein